MMQEFNFSDHIFGTDCHLSIVHDNQVATTAIAEAAFKKLKTDELCYSRFLPTSELTRLNTETALVVNPEFFAIVTEAKTLYERTTHLYNPLVQVSTLGYEQSRDNEGNIVPPENIRASVYNTDFSAVITDTDTNRVTLAPTQKLDLGGLLKGYLADTVAHLIYEEGGVNGVILNIGGDLAAYGYDENHAPFTCTIFNPITQTESAPLTLQNQCLATSGTYNRRWLLEGHETSHIVDPTTKQNPTSNIISASIIHQHGSYAEAFAKVFLIAGSARAQEILAGETYSYYLIDSDGTITTNLEFS